jgi:hypothetical protein
LVLIKVRPVGLDSIFGKSRIEFGENIVNHVILLLGKYNNISNVKYINNDILMISVRQIKAGRSMLNWSAADLAKASGVGPATVRRYEMQDGIPAGNTSTLVSIQSALEQAGIEFTGDPLVNPGVTLRIKHDD